MRISLERSILVAEQFLQELIKKYGKYLSPLMVVVVHGIHKHVDFWNYVIILTHSYYYEKNIIIERTIQYIKDRTGQNWNVWWLFPCQKDNCTLEHVRNWFNLFVEVYNNSMTIFAKWTEPVERILNIPMLGTAFIAIRRKFESKVTLLPLAIQPDIFQTSHFFLNNVVGSINDILERLIILLMNLLNAVAKIQLLL